MTHPFLLLSSVFRFSYRAGSETQTAKMHNHLPEQSIQCAIQNTFPLPPPPKHKTHQFSPSRVLCHSVSPHLLQLLIEPRGAQADAKGENKTSNAPCWSCSGPHCIWNIQYFQQQPWHNTTHRKRTNKYFQYTYFLGWRKQVFCYRHTWRKAYRPSQQSFHHLAP